LGQSGNGSIEKNFIIKMHTKDILDSKTLLAKKPHLYQAISAPILALKFFLWTRITTLLNTPYIWTAKTFWGFDIAGYFPEPVFSYIYLNSFLEESVTRVLVKYLKPGMTFIDVGAHIGYFSTLASNLVGNKGQVISFEPTPETYKILLRNVGSLKNVVTNNNAVWSNNKFIELHDYGVIGSGCNSFSEGRMSAELLKQNKPRIFSVGAVALDDYFAIYKVRPSFIKIDAESAELEILQGLKKTLKTVKPMIVVEIGDKQEQKGRTEKLIALMRNNGYKALEYANGVFKEHLLLNTYLNLYENLLFLPK
jgi:FkbM family methyltransferase